MEAGLDRPREPLPTRIQDLPALPPAAEAALAEGLAALRLSVTPEARAVLEGHLRLLLAWTEAVNLTAIRDPVAAVSLHVLDSLQAVAPLRAMGTERLLDLGSGGGYPGLPLAVAVPAHALLVESVGKKTAFLEAAVATLGLEGRITVAQARVEALAKDPTHRGRWPVVTARAVAALPALVELAFPLLRIGGRLLAWKRGSIDAELAGARRAADALGGGTISLEPVTLPALMGHVLVVVQKGGPTPDGYPRDPATRSRRPW